MTNHEIALRAAEKVLQFTFDRAIIDLSYGEQREAIAAIIEAEMPATKTPDNAELLEKLADIEHDRWASWQRHLHSKCTKVKDGLLIPEYLVKYYQGLIETKYADLPEEQKEKDRIEARRSLAEMPKAPALRSIGWTLINTTNDHLATSIFRNGEALSAISNEVLKPVELFVQEGE